MVKVGINLFLIPLLLQLRNPVIQLNDIQSEFLYLLQIRRIQLPQRNPIFRFHFLRCGNTRKMFIDSNIHRKRIDRHQAEIVFKNKIATCGVDTHFFCANCSANIVLVQRIAHSDSYIATCSGAAGSTNVNCWHR